MSPVDTHDLANRLARSVEVLTPRPTMFIDSREERIAANSRYIRDVGHREMAIAKRHLRAQVNRVRKELGLPSVERESLDMAKAAMHKLAVTLAEQTKKWGETNDKIADHGDS